MKHSRAHQQTCPVLGSFDGVIQKLAMCHAEHDLRDAWATLAWKANPLRIKMATLRSNVAGCSVEQCLRNFLLLRKVPQAEIGY